MIFHCSPPFFLILQPICTSCLGYWLPFPAKAVIFFSLHFLLFCEVGSFSFKNHIFCHISGTTGPTGLKFFVRAYFGHPVAHTKLQPLRLKDAEDIGWCVRNARGARGFHRTVAELHCLKLSLFLL